MYASNPRILHYCIVVRLMKKKPHEHPKLFLNVVIEDNSVYLLFKQNQFNENLGRIILKEKLSKNMDLKKKELLTHLNKNEYGKLKKYIKVQKRVLDIHEKDRNYDACKMVKSSIARINEFKIEFEDWFLINGVQA